MDTKVVGRNNSNRKKMQTKSTETSFLLMFMSVSGDKVTECIPKTHKKL